MERLKTNSVLRFEYREGRTISEKKLPSSKKEQKKNRLINAKDVAKNCSLQFL